jgi:hypothetical protein
MGKRFARQYRLVWKYEGQKHPRILVSDNSNSILRMLRRVGTDEPWMGVTPVQFKRCWAWVARRLNIDFGAVAHMGPREALLALRDSFPKLEYIRVDSRQVAPWVELIDPLESLRTMSTGRADQKRLALFEEAESMSEEELAAWRWTPDPEREAFRRRRT